MTAGVIVAGGRSTRFGDRDKAVAELAGVPMVRRVADRVEGLVNELVVNCRSEQTDSLDDALEGYARPVRFAEDEEPDRGPMAGIRMGLRAAEETYAFVVACDMPFVDPALVEHLLDRADGHDAAVPRLDDRWFQTTHAVYRAEPMAAACEDALERGEHKILEPLFELDYVVVDDEEVRRHGTAESFENVNTREEFEAAAARL